MKRMTEKQISYVQGILEHLLEYAERTKNKNMEKDIMVLSDILNKTAMAMPKPEATEPQDTPETRGQRLRELVEDWSRKRHF